MSRLITRPAFRACGTIFVIFLVALVAFLALGTPGRRVVSVLSSRQDPRQTRGLIAYLEGHGGHNCRSIARTATPQSTFVALTLAVAAVSCDAVGPGARHVGARQFATAADVAAWELDRHDDLAGTGIVGSCVASGGETNWAANDGPVAGRFYCGRNAGGGAFIQWTNRALRTGYVADSDSAGVPSLISWWTRHIKGPPVGGTAGLSALKSVFTSKMRGGLSSCAPAESVLADAGLSCAHTVPSGNPAMYVDTLSMFHFHTRAALDAFFGNYEAIYYAPSGAAAERCTTEAQSAGPYDTGGRPAGRLFCFPADNSQVLVWTIDAANIAAVITRADEMERPLYRAWQNLF